MSRASFLSYHIRKSQAIFHYCCEDISCSPSPSAVSMAVGVLDYVCDGFECFWLLRTHRYSHKNSVLTYDLHVDRFRKYKRSQFVVRIGEMLFSMGLTWRQELEGKAALGLARLRQPLNSLILRQASCLLHQHRIPRINVYESHQSPAIAFASFYHLIEPI